MKLVSTTYIQKRSQISGNTVICDILSSAIYFPRCSPTSP